MIEVLHNTPVTGQARIKLKGKTGTITITVSVDEDDDDQFPVADIAVEGRGVLYHVNDKGDMGEPNLIPAGTQLCVTLHK